ASREAAASVFVGSDVADWVFPWRVRRRQKLLDEVKERGNLTIVLLDLAGQVAVGGENLADLHEGPHDGDVHLNGALAAKHAGQHRHAEFGEDVRRLSEAHFRGRI